MRGHISGAPCDLFVCTLLWDGSTCDRTLEGGGSGRESSSITIRESPSLSTISLWYLGGGVLLCCDGQLTGIPKAICRLLPGQD